MCCRGRKPPGREEVRAAPWGDNDKVLNSRDAVETALEGLTKLVGGYADGTFRPMNYATRAQYCKMLYQSYGVPANVDRSGTHRPS